MSEDEYLLHNYKIESGKGDFDKKELNDYIKQKPNKRIIFWRFYLSLYNLSSPEKENGFNNWLRRIGEPPAVYDEDLMLKSTEQLTLHMRNKGFYEAEVSDTTLYRKRRARVVYRVSPSEPYRIRDITYFFEDATLSHMVLADTTSNKFRAGELFDVDVLQEERVRIETILRDSGYYAFNRDFVYYEVDSALNTHQVDITLGIRNFPNTNRRGKTVHTDHPVYTIRDVHMMTDFNAMTFAKNSDEETLQRDTLVYDSVYLVYSGKPNIRPAMVTQKNYIIPGSLYDASDVNRTYRNLSSLSAFRMVDIRFREVDSEEPQLDCDVLVAPATRQSYTVKVEGTNSAGNIGAAANVSYRHRNLFGGSEQFDLTFMGAIENIRPTGEESDTAYTGPNIMQEFGVEARLRIPQFLLPVKTDQFIRKYNPQTNIRLSYNYQKRPDYIRTMANASFGYDWKGNEKLMHRVYPFEASLILTPYKRDDFQDWLEGKYLYYSYEPHLIIDTRYSLIWSNQKLLKNQSFQDLRLNLEGAGNLLYAGFSAFASDPGDNNYQILGVDFAQYVKADIDFRSYIFLYEDISLVLRGFAGVGYAYANSNAMPFEKQYFSGGANSIRAWQVKDLGPGSYNDPEESAYPNQTGDVKLEVNMEYRFKLFWKLEAAFFLDAGNIWSLSSEDDRVGAGFEFNRFYREIAVGTGVGTRAVFSFLIFRFDLGIPLRSPYAIEGSNWLPGNSGISGKDLTFNIAIGYPF
ncbi:MAG: BamA/TamA family outer membrane protein [Bacteroidales bacterium]|nr:BamA/TamA family outer membrane protein [Bacteroidales bacterium]